MNGFKNKSQSFSNVDGFDNANGELRRQIGTSQNIPLATGPASVVDRIPGARKMLKKAEGFSKVDGFDNMEGLENMDQVYSNATGKKLKPEMKAGLIVAGTILLLSGLAYFATGIKKG